MNDASSVPGASLIPGTTDLFTTAHLVVIAIFAAIVVIGILWGMRLSRTRHQADRDLAEHQETLGAPADSEAAEPPAAAPRAAAPPPVPPRSEVPHAAAEEASDPLADEPIAAAAAPFEASSATEAADATSGTTPGGGMADEPVTRLKGLGPKVAAKLAEDGITSVGQIAALDADGAARLDARLGAFSGRMARDRWIEQARFLAAGDTAGFEQVFGRL